VLDSLAVDFEDGGWNVKALLKRIVMSATFRQSSRATAAKLEQDPENRWLARGPSFRLSAEMLRDPSARRERTARRKTRRSERQALATAGHLGGRRREHPGRLPPDVGENGHRRSLYTFRKRTAPRPTCSSSTRAVARSVSRGASRRTRRCKPWSCSTIPVFFECARRSRSLARASRRDPTARIRRAFRRLAAREPREAELAALLELYDREFSDYSMDAAAAKAGERGRRSGCDERPHLARR